MSDSWSPGYEPSKIKTKDLSQLRPEERLSLRILALMCHQKMGKQELLACNLQAPLTLSKAAIHGLGINAATSSWVCVQQLQTCQHSFETLLCPVQLACSPIQLACQPCFILIRQCEGHAMNSRDWPAVLVLALIFSMVGTAAENKTNIK